MKNRKFLLMAAAILSLSITACGGKPAESKSSSSATPSSESSADPSSESPSSSVAPSSSSVAPSSSSVAPSSSSVAPSSSSEVPSSSSEAPSKSVTYASSSFVKGDDGKVSLVVTGTQANYDAAEFKFAFGLSDGTNFVVGKETPEDADYKFVPTLGEAGAFSVSFGLEDLEGIAEGEFNVYLGPKGAYADGTSNINITSGATAGAKYRFATRADDNRLQIFELPPISFTEAAIRLVENKPVLYFGGATTETEAEVLAHTPWIQVQSVGNPVYGYEQGFETWRNHDLNAVMVYENNKAFVTADVSELPNASYNVHFNLSGAHSGEAVMDNAIDQSENKVVYNGKNYWCWSDPTAGTNDQEHFWGHLGFVIANGQFNVTPDLNYDGAEPQDPIPTSGLKITLPADPVREGGYSFLGWFLTKEIVEDEVALTNNYEYTADTTIYAHWAQHTHVAGTDWLNNASKHWHACVAEGCPLDGYKMDEADHTFGDWSKKTDASCEAAGLKERTCSVCGYVDVAIDTAKLDHNYGDVVDSHATSTDPAYVATTVRNCSLCNKAAYRWSARDFDATLSSKDLDLTHDGDKSVRFASGAVENKGGAASTGSHIIYNVNVPAAVENASLAFNIKNTGGASGNAPVFNGISGDSSVGAIANGDGTFTTATKRYGLKVNDVEYFLGEDSYGNQSSKTGWFDWPVNFPLKEGVNKIDVFAYGGYRADIYDLQLTGLPHVESTHTHALGNWQSNETNHWKLCTGANCPAGADAHFEEAAHTFGEQFDVVPATCSVKGSYKVKCTVCEYVKTVQTPTIAHTFGDAQDAVGDAIPHECSVCHAVGYELAIPSPQKLKSDVSWNIAGLPAGNYEIQLNACASSTTLPQKYDSRYQFKVDSGAYIGASDDNATYASYGLGTGEAIGNVKWSSAINTIAVGEGAAQFTIHWTNKGYSAFIAAVRLVKVAA